MPVGVSPDKGTVTDVKVYIGETELTDIVDTQVTKRDAITADRIFTRG